LYHLLRANVDGVESDYCDVPEGDRKNDRVKHLHGHKVTGIEEKSDKILVRYETSDAEKGAMEADLVIGADGPSSTAARY
jgi:2-polyprenyl-6-methoxyphenol hydroxylase-like FAD-dependent oxidoreductase